ncbi:MAG: helix-turn-helix domain-containing protein [Acidimicrobiales bacterium]
MNGETDGTATMDVGEVAETLGIEPADVYRAIDRGDLAATNVARRIRVRPADVEVFRATSSAGPRGQ